MNYFFSCLGSCVVFTSCAVLPEEATQPASGQTYTKVSWKARVSYLSKLIRKKCNRRRQEAVEIAAYMNGMEQGLEPLNQVPIEEHVDLVEADVISILSYDSAGTSDDGYCIL